MTCRDKARIFAAEAVRCWRKGDEKGAQWMIDIAIEEWRKGENERTQPTA